MSVTNYPGDPKDPSDDTPIDALTEKSLKAAGYAYLVGDAGLFASGMMAGRTKEAITGLSYALGGLICAKYGNPNTEQQLKHLSKRLSSYLDQQGIEIPKSPDTELLTQKAGVIDHIESFLYKYPAQIFNTMSCIGAVQLLRSGIQHGKGWDTASGALVAAGALGGLLIQEKKPDPDHPPKGMLGKALSWLQEKPLRISGGLYAMNNVALAVSAFKEMKSNPAQKSYLFKYLTAASFMFGNSMMMLTSKDNHGESKANTEAMEKLAVISAHVVAAQPQEVQEALIQHIAGYLSSQPETHMQATEIDRMLHSKLNEVRGMGAPGSWMSRIGNVNTTPSLPSF